MWTAATYRIECTQMRTLKTASRPKRGAGMSPLNTSRRILPMNEAKFTVAHSLRKTKSRPKMGVWAGGRGRAASDYMHSRGKDATASGVWNTLRYSRAARRPGPETGPQLEPAPDPMQIY